MEYVISLLFFSALRSPIALTNELP
jgi:ATP-dependent Clp protease ATP-binding subunit ClpA